MNFPVGEVVGKGSVPFDLTDKARELFEKRFNGYIIAAVRGHFIEEGVLFFREGGVAGCVVECLAADKLIKGSEALSYFANESVGKGFFQIVSLSRSQVDLVFAFDEKLLADKIDLKDIPKMIPSAFSPRFLSAVEEKSALDTYGLGDLK